MGMKRVSVDGKVINQRTADMLKRVEARLGFGLYIVQGSYNSGVSQSAGTHDGGGAVDISVSGMSGEKIRNVVLQMRKCGFAAWYRTSAQGPWSPHIHAIAIGDAELSSGARQQVSEYYAGYDGLAGSGRDDGPRLDPIPVWPIRLAEISLERVQRQFTADKKRRTEGVKRIQRLLNYRMDRNLAVDGIAGPKTRDAYKDWERRVDAENIDGIPSSTSLRKLVAGFYRVTK